MAGRLAASGGSRKKIVNPAGMTADGRQQSKVQANNKRSARQCGPRRLFAPRKAPACIGVRQLCRKKIRCWGLGTPTTAGESRQLQCPKVPKVRTESPLMSPREHTPFPGWGLTRRLRREQWGFRPEGGRTFFRSERKYQRKQAARRLREKGFYCPF